jgi:hypothetical protein
LTRADDGAAVNLMTQVMTSSLFESNYPINDDPAGVCFSYDCLRDVLFLCRERKERAEKERMELERLREKERQRQVEIERQKEMVYYLLQKKITNVFAIFIDQIFNIHVLTRKATQLAVNFITVNT